MLLTWEFFFLSRECLNVCICIYVYDIHQAHVRHSSKPHRPNESNIASKEAKLGPGRIGTKKLSYYIIFKPPKVLKGTQNGNNFKNISRKTLYRVQFLKNWETYFRHTIEDRQIIYLLQWKLSSGEKRQTNTWVYKQHERVESILTKPRWINRFCNILTEAALN